MTEPKNKEMNGFDLLNSEFELELPLFEQDEEENDDKEN